MTCSECVELLNEAVDGTLAPPAAARVDEHCGGCADCRSVFDDLIDIKQIAASLDRHEPPPLLRDAIRAEIQNSAITHAVRRPPIRPAMLAMAASLVLAIGAAGWFVATHSSRPTTASNGAAELATAASELQLAEQHYLNAIASLEKLTADKQAKLDPQVADAITQSLNTIDKAIGDSRAALTAQPDSLVAQTSLLEALRMKVALLQETVSLMNARS